MIVPDLYFHMSSSEEEEDCYLAKRHLERLTGTCQSIIEKVQNHVDADITVAAGKEKLAITCHRLNSYI